MSAKLIAAMEARMPWQAVGKPLLDRLELESSRGWRMSRSKLNDLTESQRAALEAALVQHSIAGEKCIQLIEIPPELRKKVKSSLNKTSVDEAFAEHFPILAHSDHSAEPRLAHIAENHLSTVHTAIRKYDQRVEIAQDKLVEAERGRYDKVIGMRSVERRVFDSVHFLPDYTHAVLAADFPKEAPADFAATGIIFLRHFVSGLAGQPLQPINLFKAIERLYKKGGGVVVEMGFSTGKSTKREKMRISRQCLRKEAYHVGGSAAVNGAIDIYHIALDWAVKHVGWTSRPELTLRGTAYDLHNPNPVLDHAVVRNGIVTADLEFIANKLLAFA